MCYVNIDEFWHYSASKTLLQAVAEIRELAGAQFDVDLVEPFCKSSSEYAWINKINRQNNCRFFYFLHFFVLCHIM